MGAPNGQLPADEVTEVTCQVCVGSVAARELRDVDEEPRVDVMPRHRAMERRQHFLRMVKAVSRQDDALPRAFEQRT